LLKACFFLFLASLIGIGILLRVRRNRDLNYWINMARNEYKTKSEPSMLRLKAELAALKESIDADEPYLNRVVKNETDEPCLNRIVENETDDRT